MQQVVRLSQYESDGEKLPSHELEPFLLVCQQRTAHDQKYKTLNEFLVKHKIFYEDEKPEQRKQIELQQLKTAFVNWAAPKQKKVENLGDFCKKVALPDDLQALQEDFKKTKCCPVPKPVLAQTIRYAENGVSYKQFSQQIVQFLSLNQKQTLKCFFIKINQNEELLENLLKAVLFQLMHSKCKDEQFSQQVLDLVQTLVNFYNVHKKTHENQRSLFTTPKHMSFVPLSTRANHYRFKQYSSDSALDLSLRRAIDYRTGNRFVQQNYPTWLGSRGSLASSTYINSLLNALGYNEPEYVDPPESPNILEVTEEDNEAEKLLKLREETFANPDSYQLAGFVVDDDEEEEELPPQETSEEKLQKKIKKQERAQKRERKQLMKKNTELEKLDKLEMKQIEPKRVKGVVANVVIPKLELPQFGLKMPDMGNLGDLFK